MTVEVSTEVIRSYHAIHPNTGRARDDHLDHALWLGERLPVRAEVLSNDPARDVISPVVPNTKFVLE
jgi:hypothetical protein